MAKSYKSIYSALAANLLIAITKFIAGAVSNSSAMISEGIHSVADTINQVLLLFGIKQSKKPADVTRPFGYGRELFFWSFIVSILIFGLGGGLSIYQGITHILHPQHLEDPFWNYMVLIASIVFEGASLVIAGKEFNKTRGDLSWWKAIKRSKDPTSFVVLFEDGAAVLGLFIVLICVFLGQQFNLPFLDGLASLLVGLLLVFVSMVLARESHSLLMGEGVMETTRVKIINITESNPNVVKVERVFSMYQSPEEILVILWVTYKAGVSTAEIYQSIKSIRIAIKKEFKLVSFVIIQPEI